MAKTTPGSISALHSTKKKMGGWGLSAAAERRLSEFMRSLPAAPSIHVDTKPTPRPPHLCRAQSQAPASRF
jgi:hypothetical protein